MLMASQQFWIELRRHRCELADRIESLPSEQWDSRSWCEGWRVRDVLGHLVNLAESTNVSMLISQIRSFESPDRTLDRAARRLGEEPVPDLAARLRSAADGRFHVIGSPASVALGEVFVHGADALRPAGVDLDVSPVEVLPILNAYRRVGWLAFHAAPSRGRRLVATDAGWAQGQGPQVNGRAVDLLLLLANRRQVLPLLEGPGTEGL